MTSNWHFFLWDKENSTQKTGNNIQKILIKISKFYEIIRGLSIKKTIFTYTQVQSSPKSKYDRDQSYDYEYVHNLQRIIFMI